MRRFVLALPLAILFACASSNKPAPAAATPAASSEPSTPSTNATPTNTAPAATPSAVPVATAGAAPVDPALAAQGRKVFEASCVACHRADGGGQIGPNLTDGAWLHGGTPEAIERSVRDGWTPKGMPAWGPLLGDDKVRAVVAYVRSIGGTNVPNGKAPQAAP